MPDYRVFLGDVVTGELLDELPLISASYNHVLNQPGDCEVTLSLVQPPDKNRVLRGALVPPTGTPTPDTAAGPGRSTIVVSRDGVLVWGGLLWQMAVNLGEATATLKAQGWHSYFRHRVITTNLTFSQVDQAEIAADLIDYAQSAVWDTVRVDTSGVQPTGVLRDRAYLGNEYKPIAEAVEQLSQVLDGFDFRYTTHRDEAGIFTRFWVDYPATGRTTGIVLVLGNQVSGLSTTVDATQIATVAFGVGSDDLRAGWHTTFLRGVYPRLDAVVSHTDVSIKSTLDNHVIRRLRRGRAPVTIPAVQIDANLQPPLGAYRVGDLADVRGEVGWYSFSGTYRMTKIQVGVDENGGETVTVDLAQQAVML